MVRLLPSYSILITNNIDRTLRRPPGDQVKNRKSSTSLTVVKVQLSMSGRLVNVWRPGCGSTKESSAGVNRPRRVWGHSAESGHAFIFDNVRVIHVNRSKGRWLLREDWYTQPNFRIAHSVPEIVTVMKMFISIVYVHWKHHKYQFSTITVQTTFIVSLEPAGGGIREDCSNNRWG